MKTFFLSITILLLSSITASAHFGMIIPSQNVVGQNRQNTQLVLSFSHPFEGIGLELSRPKKFYVVNYGERTDLLPTLEKTEVMGHQAWEVTQPIRRPGVYHFVMEPQPYWEPTEDIHIIHYTKTTIAAYGETRGWDVPVGLPTEIVPKLRPFGNYVGNTFTAQVLIAGKPAVNAEVEVEFYNEHLRYSAPSDYHVTQVIKTDNNGVFHFSCNLPGWWGFSALSDADYTLADPDGNPKGVELGAVFWLYFAPFIEKNPS